jgi:DNA-binding transcriptional LysR family regulator
MDIKRLKAFYLVAKHGSLLQAANHLKLSVPSVSIQIKKLESELNAALFQRLPNKLVLTDQGRVFVREAKNILDGVERAKASIETSPDASSGKLSLSMGTDIAKYFAPKIASFVRNQPRLEITLLARPSPETLSLVLGGDVDIGIGRFKSIPRGLVRRKLLENGVWCAFPHRHTLARKEKLDLSDLCEHRLITLTRNSGMRKNIDRVFRRNRIEPEGIIEVGSCQSTMDFVRLGLGIGLTHDLCVLSEPKNKLSFRDMSPIFGKAEVTVIYRRNSVLSTAHKALLEIISTPQ